MYQDYYYKVFSKPSITPVEIYPRERSKLTQEAKRIIDLYGNNTIASEFVNEVSMFLKQKI